MVNHFHGRIHYYALWNEEDIGYCKPGGNPEQFGRLLKAFIPAVHETDPDAKVIFGGQADPNRDFAQRALDTCQCASGIDVFDYHTYPGYGQNLNPEAMDGGAYGLESPAKLRELVRNYPGITIAKARCRTEVPPLEESIPGHATACHLAGTPIAAR